MCTSPAREHVCVCTSVFSRPFGRFYLCVSLIPYEPVSVKLRACTVALNREGYVGNPWYQVVARQLGSSYFGAILAVPATAWNQ